MDNKTLSDFMPKVSSEGEITYGEKSSSQSVTLTNDHIIKVLTDIKAVSYTHLRAHETG